MKKNNNKIWLIIISIVLAMMLVALPLPRWISWLRPDWVVLILIYWLISTPYLISVGWAWLIGLLLDALFGSPLGEHGLALVVIAYFIVKFYIRIQLFNLWQKILLVFVAVFIYRLIIFWVQGLMGEYPVSFLYWIPCISGPIFWAWIFVLLHEYEVRLSRS